MSDGDNASLISGLLCLLLVGSALAARRLPLGQTLKMALAWVGIFGAFFFLFLFRDEFSEAWRRAKVEIAGGSSLEADGTVRVRKDDSGHFNLMTDVNGKSLIFLVDTGATTTSLSTVGAKSAGVEVDPNGFPVAVQTANGMALDRRARIEVLKVGPIKRVDFPVHVSEGLGETNVLGMNFLSSLNGWRVQGDELILNP